MMEFIDILKKEASLLDEAVFEISCKCHLNLGGKKISSDMNNLIVANDEKEAEKHFRENINGEIKCGCLPRKMKISDIKIVKLKD